MFFFQNSKISRATQTEEDAFEMQVRAANMVCAIRLG